MSRALAGLAALALLFAATALAASGEPGAPGVGDPFFPNAGNGGYEVDHYDLTFGYRPSINQLDGFERVKATATETLSRFDLDLRGFHLKFISVNGEPASVARSGQELQISPSAPLPEGQPFKVILGYLGKPHAVRDPDGTLDGWIKTDDGAVVASEPQGAPTWFAANDHPSDKATFSITAVVRRGLQAISNGEFVRREPVRRRQQAWYWNETAPMATYLATVAIGRFRITRSTFDGIDSLVAVDRTVTGDRHYLAQIPQIVRFLSRRFGPYPFADAGAIVDPSETGYALETQTRPLMPGPGSLAHELAHQWFGDSVSLERWSDIWLNEGFAAFATWLWEQHEGGPTLEHDFASAYSAPASDDAYWNPPPADPGSAKNLFDTTIYLRGAMALEALREKVGSHDFYAILRAWAQGRRYGNGTIPEFIQTAEAVTGLDLQSFFSVWLYRPGKPAPGSW